ncbi:MAG TPA: hypothetical protein VFD73_19775, partial [Gemmatimonadales bacterium]|nr:hypothetical protein [Gemmatimonadales bacterium]
MIRGHADALSIVLLASMISGGWRASNHASPAGDFTALPVDPGSMAFVDTIDDRYQSYNIEMLEVTGGKFWKPY